MPQVVLLAPLSGVMVPIEDVPDPVFATRMVGDGISIDPVSACLLAPCAGTVSQLHSAGHALTVTHASGVEVMIHIGLDTVALKGEGLRPRVKRGDTVAVGDALIDFDADLLARRARSLLTQVVITNGDCVASMTPASGMVVAGRDRVLTIEVRGTAAASGGETVAAQQSAALVVPNPLGLHARPAAVLAGLARTFASEIELLRGADRANAKSVTGLMTMEVKHGDTVSFSARGADAGAALEALVQALQGGLGEDVKAPPAPATTSAATTGTAAAAVVDERPGVLRGVSASPGLAVGTIFQLVRQQVEVAETAADSARERRTLERAIEQARGELEVLEGRLATEADASKAAIFAAHREILDDPDLSGPAWQAISGGKSAGWAWRTACKTQAERLAALGNPLLAQRATDVHDVGERVLRLVVGAEERRLDVPAGSLLIAEDLTPTDTATLDRTRVVGFATLLGGPTSHVAILARSLDLPAIAAIDPRATSLANGTLAVLDGGAGTLRVDPPAAEVEEIRTRLVAIEAERKAQLAHAAQPAVTRDGRAIEVAANLGKADEAAAAVSMGAEGCGLLRSEFLFMGRSTAPSEDEQAAIYSEIARAFGSQRKLVIRTLDVGGDKPLPYLPIGAEENPFLGERGLRVSLLRPALLRTQFRAILRAASLAAVHVMLPMVTTLDEFRRARAMFDEERAALGVGEVPLGVMIEVPAAALCADVLAREAAFFSIGTNDLTQYTLAIDRGHPRLAAMADGLHPAVLRLVGMTCEAAHRHGRWVGVCGGMGGDLRALPLLVGLGVDELSVPVPSVPAVKAALRTLDSTLCRSLAERALTLDSGAAVRALTEG